MQRRQCIVVQIHSWKRHPNDSETNHSGAGLKWLLCWLFLFHFSQIWLSVIFLWLSPFSLYAELYSSVWEQVARLVSPLPPPDPVQTPNHAADCDDSLAYEYPFVLKVDGSENWDGRSSLRFSQRLWRSRVIFTIWTCHFCVKNIFPFPLATDKLTGDIWTNRQSGIKCSSQLWLRQ